jgi:aspartyl-tRNA(Asn)/glutamyl-tRNA(Gln) amidotransferase subunit A
VVELADLRQRHGGGALGVTPALHALPAGELADAYRARTLSPVEATQAVLERIAACEPLLHATWALDADAALAAARDSEARWRAGTPRSALDGVPCTLKENIATRGVPMPGGSAATVLVPATDDAPPAARLREAGAVIVCKTTMPDWGMLSSGLSSFHVPPARNPWDLSQNPGGSSAGAGAAAAAGYGPLHLGTDIGGSIRLPAAWCGVVGFKPSLGRVPIKPPYLGRVAGPLTRSVADTARLMAVLSQADWRDAMSLPPTALDWLDLERHVKGLRVGLLLDAGWGLPVDPEIRAIVEAAAQAFERAGAHVEALAPFSTRAMIDGLDAFWRMRSWLDYSALPPERQARVLPYIADWVRSAQAMSGEHVFRGYHQIGVLRDAAVAACQPYDVVLSPASPVVSFPFDWPSPLNDPARPFEHIAFTLPYNMSEQPAISVNAGYAANGMPVGLQIAGRRHDDLGVLRAARAWEQLRPAQREWPAVA